MKTAPAAALLAVLCFAAPAESSDEAAPGTGQLVQQCRYVLTALAKKPETLKFFGATREVSDDTQMLHLEFSVERLEGLPLPGELTCTFTRDDAEPVMTLFTFKPRDQEPQTFKPGKFPELKAALDRIRKGQDP